MGQVASALSVGPQGIAMPKNPLLRFLAIHLIFGIGVGWTLLAILIAFNVAQLRELLFEREINWLALILLMFFFAITFGSASMGTAVMSMERDDEEPPEK